MISKSARRVTAGLLTSVAAAALFAPAHAQTAASGDSAAAPMVGEVVVTATRRQQSLQEVPMAVDVVTGQQISKLNIFDFHDVSQLAPGVQLTNNDGRTNIISMRGITFDPDSGAPPAVDLYVNEYPIDAQTALTAIYDVGQIEVLRGPQGIFRGRTSPAGSITMTTRRPDLNGVSGYLQASGSNRDAENLQGAVSLPIVEDKLAVRVAGLIDHNRANGVRNLNQGGDYSRSKTESYRVSLRAEPTDDFHANLTYQYLHSNVRPYVAAFGPGGEVLPGSGMISGPPLSIGDRRSVTEGVPRFQNRTNLLTLQTAKDFSFATLSVDLGYQNTVLAQSRDLDVANAVPGYQGAQTVKIGYKNFNADVRLSSVAAGPFTWMIGGTFTDINDYANVSQAADQFQYFPFPLPAGAFPFRCLQGAAATVSLCDVPVTASVDTSPRSVSYSAFATLGYKVTDKLRVQGGIRYSIYNQSQQSYLSVNAAGQQVLSNLPTVAEGSAIRDYDPVTGGVSVTYDINHNVTTYVSWGHSYRIGTAAVGVVTPLATDLLVTPPESSNAYELGLKAELWDRRISFSGDVFYQKFHNYIGHLAAVNIASAADGVIDSSAPLNTAGDVISKGFEATAAAHLGSFDASVQAAYADAHYDNARVPCNAFDAAGNPVIPVGQQVAYCVRDDRITQVPKFSLTSTAEYRFGEIHNSTPFIRGLVTYRPGFHSDVDNFKYPSWTNVNLYAGVRGPEDRWELSVWSKNLLGQARPLSVSDSVSVQQAVNGLGGPNPFLVSGYRTAVITPPREFGATFQVNF